MAARRRLFGPAAWVLLVVDVLLLAILAWLLLASASSGDEPSSAGSAPATSASEAGGATEPGEASTDASAEPVIASETLAGSEGDVFTSPTGNITCQIGESGVTCWIASFSYSPPVIAGCEHAVGNIVELDLDGARMPCSTAEAPAQDDSLVPVLNYEESVTRGAFTCSSSESGITCASEQGSEFTLARAVARLT